MKAKSILSSQSPVRVYLSKEEHLRLNRLCQASGYSKSAYFRSLLNLSVPKPKPPIEYHLFMSHLSAIGNNLNQIAKVANAFGIVKPEEWEQISQELKTLILEIRREFQLPEKMTDGDHKD